MDSAQFWKLIDDARTAVEDSAEEKDDFLTFLDDKLSELEPAEVASFHTHLMTQFGRTYHWDLVAAAVIIFGVECDDLDIDGFRAWVISRGEEFLANTLQNADSLGSQNLIPDELYWVDLLNLPSDIYEQLTGDDLPDDATPAHPEQPAGKEFQVKDLPTRLPSLADDFAFFLPGDNDLDPAAVADEDDDDEAFDAILADVSDDENPYAET